MKLFVRLLMVFSIAIFGGGLIAMASGIPAHFTVPGMLAASFIPQPKGVLAAGITPEIWTDFIAQNLYKGIEFLNLAFNADQFVVGGGVVHIPQAGAGVSGKRNRQNLPASITKRTDNDVTYALDEYTTDPMLISNAEKMELSYDKMQSVLDEHLAYLRQLMGDWGLYHWAPTKNIIRTTGSSVTAHLDGATGNRKAFTVADLKKGKLMMNRMLIPQENRYALLSADMLDQLTSGLTATQYRDFSNYYDAATGTIGKLEGFNIVERGSQAVRYTNAATPVKKSPDDADATADNDSALLWQKNSVEKAQGTIEIFENIKDSFYYGDVYSALVRLGARIRRTDEAGVIGAVQASV